MSDKRTALEEAAETYQRKWFEEDRFLEIDGNFKAGAEWLARELLSRDKSINGYGLRIVHSKDITELTGVKQ